MKRILYIPFIAGVLAVFWFTLSGDDSGYLDSVEKVKNQRIHFLKNAENSPFKQFNLPYQEPSYFPVDEIFRVNAKLLRLNEPSRIPIPNSDGTTSYYSRFGWASFQLMGNTYQLLILKPVGFGAMDTYFVGFADETSAYTTYGGGRYLDLDIGKSDKLVIDFNLAYNPYCAYVDGYSCPIPPKENILPIAIEAGEKINKPE